MEVTCGACVKSACIVAGPGPVMLREASAHYTFVLGQQRCPMTLFISLCQVLMIFYHDSLLSKSNTDETDGTDTSTEVRGGGCRPGPLNAASAGDICSKSEFSIKAVRTVCRLNVITIIENYTKKLSMSLIQFLSQKS